MAFRASVGTAPTTAGTAVTLTVPAGVVATDVADVIWTASGGTVPTVALTSSNGGAAWTTLAAPAAATNLHYAFYLLTGVSAGDTITLTASISNFHTVGAAWYSSVTVTGYVAGTVATRGGVSGTTIVAPAVTTTAASSTVLGLFAERDSAIASTVTLSAGTKDAFQAGSNSSSNNSAAVGSQTITSPGSSGTVTATYATASGNAAAMQVALTPSTPTSETVSWWDGTTEHAGCTVSWWDGTTEHTGGMTVANT